MIHFARIWRALQGATTEPAGPLLSGSATVGGEVGGLITVKRTPTVVTSAPLVHGDQPASTGWDHQNAERTHLVLALSSTRRLLTPVIV